MLKKIILLFSVFAIMALVLSTSAVLAKNDKNADDDWVIPEQNGTYDVPGHPGLKVKVFVHYPKIKPGPTSSPVLACYLEDPGSQAEVGLAGWRLPSTWIYTLNLSSVPGTVGSKNLPVIANNAFKEWTDAMGNNKVTITKSLSDTTITKASYDRKNIIAWGRAPGSALAVTYTWYYTATKEVAEVDTIMNSKFSWSWTNQTLSPNCADQNSYDAQDILTHELGHWVGLNDHYTSAYANNTMYGYGSKGEVKKDTLSSGDIFGVLKIY